MIVFSGLKYLTEKMAAVASLSHVWVMVTGTCTMMDFLSNAACNVHIFPLVVQHVREWVDGRCVHGMLREFIPYVDHSLAEEMFPDV